VSNLQKLFVQVVNFGLVTSHGLHTVLVFAWKPVHIEICHFSWLHVYHGSFYSLGHSSFVL